MNRKAVLTVEALPDSRFAVKVNGMIVAQCKDDADVDDFIVQWEIGARQFRYGYEIHRQPIPAIPSRQLLQQTAAGKLLKQDARAAEIYFIAAAQSLLAHHGWTDDDVNRLCSYITNENYDALRDRHQLPPQREPSPMPFSLKRFFQ